MTENKFIIVGLGEVLWDDLPSGKMPGGAPANFAYISTRLGDHGIVASRVGTDDNGRGIIEKFRTVDVDESHIQIDEEYPTGIVSVTLENGQPGYKIVETVAWDFLELNDDWRELAEKADAVCFGSLAQRNEVSRTTILDFLTYTRLESLKIFDVNLRQDFYSFEILRDSFSAANVVKLNHEELPVICEMFEIEGADEKEKARNLYHHFDLNFLCLTRGANGSLLISGDETDEHFGIKIKIADTIGAGDAFTAAMTHGILREWNVKRINDFANKTGAFVASQTGAMPSFENADFHSA
jgi:fructokinase